jgi:hypothetical protein
MDVGDEFMLRVIERIEESSKYQHLRRMDYMSEVESRHISDIDETLIECKRLKKEIKNAS